MADWFRSWHGAPTDPKWLGIARKAGVAPGIAVAVAWALMDRASQSDDRGSIEGYDADGLACFFGCDPEQIVSIVSAMEQKGIIENLRFSNWEKRQPKREDNSAQRVREHRERQKTNRNSYETRCNAPETRCNAPDTDTDTDTEKKEEAHASSAGVGAPLPEVDLRRKIVAAYGDNIPPDTGYIAVWMAQGYDPVICGAVVEAACQRGKRPKALKWFDEAIREAHDRRAPPPPPPAKPVAPLDLSKTTVSRWNQLIDTWRFSGEWPERMYGPPPDNPGCKVPVEILELDRKRNGAAA